MPDCASPRILTGLAEGEHVLEVEATNRYGFVEETPATYTWTIAIPPVATIESGPPATTLQTTASIVFSGTDNTTPAESLTFECSIDGTNWAACTSPYELTGLTPGAYTARVRAIDEFGNVGVADTYSWTVEAPPPPNTSVGSNVSVDLDLGAGQSATVTFASVATAGNTTADVVPGGPALPVGYLAAGASYYDIDTTAGYTAPVTVCLTYVPGSLAEPVRLLHWDADTSSWVDITTSGDPVAGEVCGVTDSLSPFALATGTTLVVPETTIESGPAATTASSTATFFFSTGDPNDPTATYECSLDGGLTWSGCESPHVIEGLVPGNYELQVVATSTSGIPDATPASHSWTVVAPDTTIDSGPAASTRSTVAEFRFSSTDPEATFECSLDGGTWGSCESNYIIEGLALGAHKLDRPRPERRRHARLEPGRAQLDGRRAEHDDRPPRRKQPTWSLEGTFDVLERRADGDVRVLARRRAVRELRLAVLGHRRPAGHVHALRPRGQHRGRRRPDAGHAPVDGLGLPGHDPRRDAAQPVRGLDGDVRVLVRPAGRHLRVRARRGSRRPGVGAVHLAAGLHRPDLRRARLRSPRDRRTRPRRPGAGRVRVGRRHRRAARRHHVRPGPADGRDERDVRVLRQRHQPGVRVLARRR